MEMDSGETLKINVMREVGVGQMIGNLQVITEGIIEALVTVDQGHAQELLPIEIELDVLGVESKIIS